MSHAPDATSTADTTRQYLRLAVQRDSYAVPIDAVREILEITRLTPVPQTPDFVRGVMNLRGAVVPVIDLAARCDAGPTAAGRRNAIVIVVVGDADEGHTVGMLVDAVYEVFDLAAEALEPTPALGTTIRGDYLRGMARLRGQFLPVLDLERLLGRGVLAELIAPAGALH